MKKIGLLSDTHNHWDERFAKYFAECDEIWHAGDFGDIRVADKLKEVAFLRGVCGNIDGSFVRMEFPEVLSFRCEEVNVVMKHIGGYPGRYDAKAYRILCHDRPQLFISGHSHILKVMYDKKLGTLHINPGAEGKYGFHNVRTLVRFEIDGTDIRNLEVIEIGLHRQKM